MHIEESMLLTLVLGGAVGNLIDRVRNDGRVIDFIDFGIWPILILRFGNSVRNVSIVDSCIVSCPGKRRCRKKRKKGKNVKKKKRSNF